MRFSLPISSTTANDILNGNFLDFDILLNFLYNNKSSLHFSWLWKENEEWKQEEISLSDDSNLTIFPAIEGQLEAFFYMYVSGKDLPSSLSNIENIDDFVNNMFFTYSIFQTDDILGENIVIAQAKNVYMITGSTFGGSQDHHDLTFEINNNEEIRKKIFSTQKNSNELFDQHDAFTITGRTINAPQNNKNVLLTKDNISEEITFILPRYYDGIDLTTKHLSIYYVKSQINENIPENISEPLFIEEINDEYIKATWTINKIVTTSKGTLTFAIIAEGDGYTDEYFWQTTTATIEVEEGIYGNLKDDVDFSFIEGGDDFKNDIYDTVQELKTHYADGDILWQPMSSL